MRIATFNLENLDVPPRAEVPLQDRIDILRPQLERLKADILCLQEINGQHRPGQPHRTLNALDVLMEGTDYAVFARAATPGHHDEGVADVHNLVTLSRWPIERFRSIRHEIIPPLPYRPVTAHPPAAADLAVSFERPMLACDIRVGDGKMLTVINVHLRAPLAVPIVGQKEAPFVWKSVAGWAEGYALSAWKRSAQALEVRLTVDRLLDGDVHANIVVTGDFNAEDHETPMKILLGADEDTGNGLLAVRSLIALDRSLADERRFSTLHHGRPQMVDHILISRALLPRFQLLEVHNETLGDELIAYGRERHTTASYHAPVVAQFADG